MKHPNIQKTADRLLSLGAAQLFLAVGLGAFGAHILRDLLTPERLATWETGTRYFFWNSLGGLILAGLLSLRAKLNAGADWSKLRWPIRFLYMGNIFFAGSLYTLCLTGQGFWGAVTPVGGLLYLTGWLTSAWLFARSARTGPA